MPVILTTKGRVETWLTAPWEEALPDELLKIEPVVDAVA